MKKILFLSFAFMVLTLPLVFAVESDYRYEYKNVEAFIKDIPAINNNLSSESIEIPGPGGFLIKDGNVLISITMNDNSTRDLYVTMKEKKAIGISTGRPEKTDYTISTSESITQGVLDSVDRADYSFSAYKNGDIKVEANGIGNKMKLFFARIFLKFV